MAIFFLEGRDLSQKEISELTGYSISSVNRILQQMILMGLVRKYRDPSLGRFVYHMSIDYLDLAIGGLEAWLKQAEASKEEIRKLRLKVESLGEKEKERAEIQHLHSMLKDIEEKMESLFEVIRKDIEELKRRK